MFWVYKEKFKVTSFNWAECGKPQNAVKQADPEPTLQTVTTQIQATPISTSRT